MKNELIGGILLILLILLLPALVTVLFNLGTEKEVKEEKESTGFSVNLKIESTGEIQNMDLETYIAGVVAAEVPASYHVEALKAQAVAARTYAYRKIITGTKVLSTDFRQGQAFLTEKELKDRWGEDYYIYMKKINDAVEATRGQILVYNDEPIEAVYHAISAGKTQAADDVWNFELPYLQSVNSPFDLDAGEYEVQNLLTEDAAKVSLQASISGLYLTDEPLAKQMKILERSEAGYIVSVQVGNEVISGEELRSAFNTRSSNMTISQSGDEMRIVTKGFGHGVGMSQFGANAMAKDGKEYQGILEHYYVGVQINNIY
ncbi:stage II sporulation protein D [Vallitalea okinawensis]|uniref:stage II sporulation protein D n=1 Tax=Vallitalea okinawensis TaxID=2078660 RepID=UPI001300843F|nr:stage II sporulation protein D [Vallitalea okinawensis]